MALEASAAAEQLRDAEERIHELCRGEAAASAAWATERERAAAEYQTGALAWDKERTALLTSQEKVHGSVFWARILED